MASDAATKAAGDVADGVKATGNAAISGITETGKFMVQRANPLSVTGAPLTIGVITASVAAAAVFAPGALAAALPAAGTPSVVAGAGTGANLGAVAATGGHYATATVQVAFEAIAGLIPSGAAAAAPGATVAGVGAGAGVGTGAGVGAEAAGQLVDMAIT